MLVLVHSAESRSGWAAACAHRHRMLRHGSPPRGRSQAGPRLRQYLVMVPRHQTADPGPPLRPHLGYVGLSDVALNATAIGAAMSAARERPRPLATSVQRLWRRRTGRPAAPGGDGPAVPS